MTQSQSAFGALSDYANKSMAEPLLSREDEADYARRWRDNGDQRALDKLIRAYGRLVVSYAMKYRRYGASVEDLIQEGNIALIDAADRFDPDREIRFSTYASWWVRAALQNYVMRNWSIVRAGSTNGQKSLFFKLRHCQAQLEHSDPDMPREQRTEEIARRLNVRIDEVETVETLLAGRDSSMNAPVGESESEFQDFIPDDNGDPEGHVTQMFDADVRRRWIYEALDGLDDRERRIILKHRLAEQCETLEQIGKELGVSKERVRQLEKRALSKLKVALGDQFGSAGDLFDAA